jgi:hypothetical protein
MSPSNRSKPVLVLNVRGAGIPEIPLGVLFLSPVGVEMDGSRVSRISLILARKDMCIARSSSSSIWAIPLTVPFGLDGLLSEDRGRRLSVVGLVE